MAASKGLVFRVHFRPGHWMQQRPGLGLGVVSWQRWLVESEL